MHIQKLEWQMILLAEFPANLQRQIIYRNKNQQYNIINNKTIRLNTPLCK